MLLANAVDLARTIMRSSSSNNIVFESDDIPFGSVEWFIYAGFSCLLVLFAGVMSGLTLGLMSLGLVELEILQRSGNITEKKQASVILPVVKKQHQLLVTLLLCNACAMEALPISLDKNFHPFVAVLLSVTFVLAFGEIIPQAICSRYGLSVGANFVWLVRILMIICYPIAYPIGKVLDTVIGHGDALFRRAQLKALVSIYSQEAGNGGELTHDETTIISGALDLTEKIYYFSIVEIQKYRPHDFLPEHLPLLRGETSLEYGSVLYYINCRYSAQNGKFVSASASSVPKSICFTSNFPPWHKLEADKSYCPLKNGHNPDVCWNTQTAEEAMTPIESTFSLDVNSKLD
ncbi:hypothetical protein CRYUN_Cryun20dG0071300 [Craigia yunnanensis]